MEQEVASRPKELRLKRKLTAIAKHDGFATAIEWIVSEVASGVTITQIAKNVAALELPAYPREELSRNWFSMLVNKLAVPEGSPSAKEQIAAARREASYVLLDEAIGIADEPADDSASVQRNRLRSDVRLRTAALWNREELGDRSGVTVSLSLGELHLDALRRRNVPHAQSRPILESGEEADYTIESDRAL
jgi:hypothetical protein